MIAIPWSAALGIELLSSGDGLAALRMGWCADLSDSDGGAAAGAVASLIDHGCGAAVMSRLGRPLLISTLNLKIDHVRPAAIECPVTVWAHCYRLVEGRAFVRAEVWDRDAEEVFAAAQGVFSINRPISV
jgi:uncharacterized protein (TIGR00369 family)